MRVRASIGSRIFFAFVAMGLTTGALGGYGIYVLSAARGFVADTYDRTLMSVSFARAAALGFTRMDEELLRLGLAPETERAAINAKLDRLANGFDEDLKVVDERSVSDDERHLTAEIRKSAARWRALRAARTTGGALEALSDRMLGQLDMLVELTADHSFVARRRATDTLSRFAYLSGCATLLALLLSAATTLLLARRIVRPLRAAAAVANRIAGGELDTPIPAGGADETGTLLRSMTVMQDNIRVMVEREQAQRRSAQNRLVEALDHSPEAVVLVGADDRILLANSQLARFFPALAPLIEPGMSFDSAFARLDELVVSVDGAATPAPDCPWRADDLLEAGRQFCLADGRWVRVSRSPTQDGGFFLVMSDFSEIKEREQWLNEARQLAEAANAAKTSFLANMSHELRTPLNAIIGFSEILIGEMFGPLGEAKYLDYAKDIFDSGRHLLTVINNVLDLTKSQAGQLRLMLEQVDLVHTVQSCTTMMRDQCARAELQLDVAAPPEPLVILGDAAKLRQIVLNLLSNAVKFTAPGGKVGIRVERQGGRAMVRVCDTGIGMSREDIPIALAPFGQVDSSLSRRYEGTGLGLPLTKVLVEMHGGSIAIESTLGAGTTVTVALPIDLSATADEAALGAAGTA